MPLKIELQWMVLYVYPISTLMFWLLYTKCWAQITRRIFHSRSTVIGEWSELQQACFYANANSCLHAGSVVVLLFVLLMTDDALWQDRLHPHSNDVGHAAMSFSLAYFSFAIPWQWNLYFWKRDRDVVNLPMVIHHLIVVFGIMLYLLSAVCAPYGTVAFICMEFTNWFFVPYTMMLQLRLEESFAHQVIGVALVLSFIVCRIVICTWQGVIFTIDLSEFDSKDGVEWAFVVLAYGVYMAALSLSWIWLRRVLLECGTGVQNAVMQFKQSRASVSPSISSRASRQARTQWNSPEVAGHAPPQGVSCEAQPCQFALSPSPSVLVRGLEGNA